jgi:hypothetical protein
LGRNEDAGIVRVVMAEGCGGASRLRLFAVEKAKAVFEEL